MAVAEIKYPAQQSGLKTLWRQFSKSKAGVMGLAVILVFIVIAILAPYLTEYDPTVVSKDRLHSPSPQHYFGTDNVGKDVFAGVLFGARVSLTVGLLAALCSFTIGSFVGSLAGYYGGIVDSVLMRVSELFQTMPSFFLALAIVAMLGGGTGVVILVLGIVSWPATARVVRAKFLSLKEQEFVEAARAMGFGDRYIIFSEILPNAMPPAVVRGTLDIASAILIEAGLSFFGLSDPSVASWGQILQRAQPYLGTAWWLSVFPGIAIFLVVLAFNLVGDALNDAINPELKER